MECPKCRKSVEGSFNFCPNCAFPLQDQKNRFPPSEFNSTDLSKAFGVIENPAPLAWRAKERLRRLGIEYGYKIALGYEDPNVDYSASRGPIDVVWMSDGRVVAAFEVRAKRSDLDVITTRRNLEKLKNFDAKEKFIVYVSSITGKASFNRVDENTAVQKPERTAYLPYNIEDIRRSSPRAFEVWTTREEEDLINGYKSGMSVSELAARHQRRIGGIVSRLKKLGLIEE